jgi:hypothetical protein
MMDTLLDFGRYYLHQKNKNKMGFIKRLRKNLTGAGWRLRWSLPL